MSNDLTHDCDFEMKKKKVKYIYIYIYINQNKHLNDKLHDFNVIENHVSNMVSE